MNELFLKNTQALFEKDQPLALKLRELKECKRFELFQGSNDNLDINILDKKRKEFIYKDPLKELDENLKLFNGEYLRYPVLFFYGLGNGILYKALLSNPIRNHLIIFEEELEIIYLVFHYLDLSEEIRNEKVVLFYTPSTTQVQLDVLMNYATMKNFYKIYNLFTHSSFYNNYNIRQTNEGIIRAIKSNHARNGNDPGDSLQGISQLTKNLVSLLSNPSLKDLIKQRKDKIENAIIVSSGPSLIKQLPLLKEYANKASIFCADGSYAILHKYGIKPDYVLSLERIEKTSEFFNNDFKEFDKDILFVLVSLVHPKTIEYLKKNNRKFILVHRPLPFAQSLNMDDYGYLGTGMSVANMAYELAVKLGHKNIVLIGQDLAYDKEGNSHPEEYLYGEGMENDRKQGLFVKAYGGVGVVETNKWWNIFREIFEKDIAISNPLGIKTYNATEGGARIEGSIEKPFNEVCKNLLKENKPLFEQIQGLSEKEIQDKKEEIGGRIQSNLKLANNFIKKCRKILHHIDKNINQCTFENISKENEKLTRILVQIDNLKNQILKNSNPYIFNELHKPLFYHYECKINELFVLNHKDDLEKIRKIISYLNVNKTWIKQYIQTLNIQNKILNQTNIKAL
ncbi:motility associated factor glycosyltransferase family protein [Campylobacter lari]|uniref:motility associated factor glycosyltransferase family protein n=1 Tax=Campylobacter lari TaxID=201 RepID=UPI001BD990FA|nr:motility associated factor glycosyltransferase family protein [Campylobacter lari]MBT0742837.1 motility associated factor glycosyltransferase family protein [Campylobacter lari]